MDEKIYSVKLYDGTLLENLRQNGNNFISQSPISPEIFDDNCAEVTISDGVTEEVHSDMELVQVEQIGDEYWFVLRDISVDELEKTKLRSDIEYIAMMTDVEL